MAKRFYQSTGNSTGVHGAFLRGRVYELDSDLPFVKSWVASGHLIDLTPTAKSITPSAQSTTPPPEDNEQETLDLEEVLAEEAQSEQEATTPIVAPAKPSRNKKS